MHQPLSFSLVLPLLFSHPQLQARGLQGGGCRQPKAQVELSQVFFHPGSGDGEGGGGRPRQNKKEAGVQTGQAFRRPRFKARPPQTLGMWLPLSGPQCFLVEVGLAAGCCWSEVWCHGSREAERGSTGALGELSAVEAPFRPSSLGPRKFFCFSSLSDEQSPALPLDLHSLTMARLHPLLGTRVSAFRQTQALPWKRSLPSLAGKPGL